MAVALNREQLKTLAGIFAVAQAKHVPYKDLLSAVETAGVEANYGNPVGGGGTSSGWRQETKSSYPNVNRRNVHGAAKRFFDELAHAGPGSPGKRAQAVQRSAYPGRYDQREAEAKAIIARYDKGGRGVSRGALEQAGLATPGKVTAHDVTTTIPGSPNPVTEADPAATSELLSSLQSQQAVAALEPAPISPPAFTARYAMARLPGGGLPQLPASPPVQPPAQADLSALEQLGVPADRSLGSSRSTRVTGQVYTGTPGTAAEGAAGGGRGHAPSRGYPLERRGKQIGVPYQGTHTLGNWQSDRAVDIAVPVGTPVLATEDGRVTKVGGQAGSSGRFAGYSITLGGKRDSYFYTHLKRRVVKPGQRVRAGQIIGYSGSANGVAHLHFAREHGDPRHNE